jgi:hypothetical protein
MRGRTIPLGSIKVVNRILGFSPSFKMKNTLAFRNAEKNMNALVNKYNLNPSLINQTGEPNPAGNTTKGLELINSLSSFYIDLKENYNLNVKQVENQGQIGNTKNYTSLSTNYEFDGITQFKLSLMETVYQKLFDEMVAEKIKQNDSEDVFGTDKISTARLVVKFELGPSPFELVKQIFDEAQKEGKSEVIKVEVKELPNIKQSDY